jgi:hypothetical protein
MVGRIVRRNRLKQTLGNLTLVTKSFNSGVSNLAFGVKRKEFEDQSILMLTKDFVKKKSGTKTKSPTEARRFLSTHAICGSPLDR